MLRKALRGVNGWFRRVAPAVDIDPPRLPGEASGVSNAAFTNADFDSIVAYFCAGIRRYRSPGRALLRYPGVPGTRGVRVEELEGFARTAPLLAAWVRTRGPTIPMADGSSFDALDHLVRGLTAGTDSGSPESWGGAGDLDQRIVEAADIALVFWMLREELRQVLPEKTCRAVLTWLGTVPGKAIHDGNWNLFPLLVGLTLEAWGEAPLPTTRAHYAEFRRCYLGRGWFSDGLHGRVDYYNAWQMHYALYFAREMDPTLDGAFISTALSEFAASFLHFFSPAGFPIFGRSACYRMALPAPLVLAAALEQPGIPAGQARRAMEVIWGHFIRRGGVEGGTVTQGYYRSQPEIMENYSGRGSCLWALRSLTAAYWIPPGAPFWTAKSAPLPIELGNYDLTLPEPGFKLIGTQATGLIELQILINAGQPDHSWVGQGLLRRIAEIILRRPVRLSLE